MKAKIVEFLSKGRGGYVIYKDEHGDIKLFYEFGGGDCLAIIYVPTIDEWKSKTNREIAQRQSILTFIAEQSIKVQAPDCYYEISENYIEILNKKTS